MPLLIVVLALGAFVAAGYLSTRRRIRPFVLIAVTCVMPFGGGLGTAPGLAALFVAAVGASTGPSSGTSWGLIGVVCVAGIAMGLAAGAALAFFVATAGAAPRADVFRRSTGAALGGLLGLGLSFRLTDESIASFVGVGMAVLGFGLFGFVVPKTHDADTVV